MKMDGKEKNAGQMPLLDMHAHLSCLSETDGRELCGEEWRAKALQELDLRRDRGIFTFFSCGTLEEWKFMQQYRDRQEIFLSFAIHPWQVQECAELRYAIDSDMSCEECGCEALQKAFSDCDAVGETGMDSVWCDVPLSLQRRSFGRQLQIAARLRKPVILHTKGMEREIAEMIRDFPEPVCVHWYSGDIRSFEAFLEQDCYFTLGPDLADQKEQYRPMLQEIPVNRLFVETDGISSVAWARGSQEAELTEIPQVLARSMDCIAEMKKTDREELYGIIWENLRRFFGRTGKTIPF